MVTNSTAMHQSVWITRVPLCTDIGDSDTWICILSKSHPYLHLLCQNPLYFLILGGGNLFIVNVMCFYIPPFRVGCFHDSHVICNHPWHKYWSPLYIHLHGTWASPWCRNCRNCTKCFVKCINKLCSRMRFVVDQRKFHRHMIDCCQCCQWMSNYWDKVKVEYHANAEYENPLNNSEKIACVGQRLIYPIMDKK